MKHSEGYVGMQVYFGRENGEQTLGKIVKINPKKFKVEQMESRGTRKSHNVGTVWTVPPSLCSPATDEKESRFGIATNSDGVECTVIDVTSMIGDALAKKVKEWDDADGSWTTAEVREAVEIVLGDGGFRAIEVIETLRALRTSDETTGGLGDWV